jgi:hypothetical protein
VVEEVDLGAIVEGVEVAEEGLEVTGEDVEHQGVRSVVQVVEADGGVAQAVVDLLAARSKSRSCCILSLSKMNIWYCKTQPKYGILPRFCQIYLFWDYFV